MFLLLQFNGQNGQALGCMPIPRKKRLSIPRPKNLERSWLPARPVPNERSSYFDGRRDVRPSWPIKSDWQKLLPLKQTKWRQKENSNQRSWKISEVLYGVAVRWFSRQCLLLTFLTPQWIKTRTSTSAYKAPLALHQTLPSRLENFFWPDMARVHYSKSVVAWLQKKGIQYPAFNKNAPNVPQTRPIERFWALCKQAYSRLPFEPRTVQQFARMWGRLSRKVSRTFAANDEPHSQKAKGIHRGRRFWFWLTLIFNVLYFPFLVQ